MADFDLIIRGKRVITRAGEVPRCVAVRDGVVVAIEPLESRLEGTQTVDLADDEVLLPGLVDTHVWMAQRPAEIARLQHKGRIERGYHADFAVFAPDDAFVIDPGRLHHRNPVTPYAQRALAGVVRSTWLRGRRVTATNPGGR